jgi:hypothetical protein
VLVLVILLIVTNLATLGVLARFLLRPADQPGPDPALTPPLSATLRPSSSASGIRRLITVEVLNPIELAGTRGRLAGIAGSLAPGLTRRLVHDQVLKSLRRQLAEERVVADVRLLVVRPEDAADPDVGRAAVRVAREVERPTHDLRPPSDSAHSVGDPSPELDGD